MTEADAVEAITQRWIDAWPTEQPEVPFCFDGEALDSSSSWVRVSIVHERRDQVTAGPTGGRLFEMRGQVRTQLYAPIDQGRGAISQLADSVRAVLEGRRLTPLPVDDLVLYAGTTREQPTDGRWISSIVSVPFLYYTQA